MISFAVSTSIAKGTKSASSLAPGANLSANSGGGRKRGVITKSLK
jgi:hypothetical protein